MALAWLPRVLLGLTEQVLRGNECLKCHGLIQLGPVGGPECGAQALR